MTLSPKRDEAAKQPILRTVNLSKRFGGLVAIDDLNFQITHKELHCIIGPNGAGKSTLFNLITGYIYPSSGQIFFNGAKLGHKNPNRICRLGIGRKFQVPNIFPSLTVDENLRLALHGKRGALTLFKGGGQNDDQEVKNILSEIGLVEKRMEIADVLSHGEKQWLEIGMVLINKPELVLLDEPTAGMSPEETSHTAKLIKMISNRVTVVVIEHDLKFIREIAHNVTVLHRGGKLAEGNLEDIMRNPEVKRVYLGDSVGN